MLGGGGVAAGAAIGAAGGRGLDGVPPMPFITIV
jgi:hypothetical protein